MKKKYFKIITNKYFIVTLLFLLQLTVFENINLFSLYKLKSQERELHHRVEAQKEEIKEIKLQSESLTDPRQRERFARERYHFKKPGEKVFIISNE